MKPTSSLVIRPATEDDSELLLDFVRALGARATREWIPFRVEGEALKRLAASA